jgi:hypothetical protein
VGSRDAGFKGREVWGRGVLGTPVGLVGGVVVGVGDDLDAAVRAADDGLPGQVELGVVVPAQHDQVVERGSPAAAPMLAVMAVAPDRGDVAPGYWQCRSRIITARRSPAGTTRVVRPTSRGWDAGSVMIRCTEASQSAR